MKLYTIGYAHKDTQATLDQHVALGGIVVDVRLSPNTNVPGFTAQELKARYKGRYGSVPELGNVNHHKPGAEISLKKEIKGFERLDKAMTLGPVILLCGCKWVHTCHRLYVARIAQGLHPGLEVEHLLQDGQEGMIKHFSSIPRDQCAYMTDGRHCLSDWHSHCDRCRKPICDIHSQHVEGFFNERRYAHCPGCYDLHLAEQERY